MILNSNVGSSAPSTIPRWVLLFLLVCTTASAGCVSPMNTARCEPNPSQKLLWAINEVREQNGLPALLVSRRLIRAAETHATAVAEGSVSGHFGADGSGPGKRILQAGYRYTGYGENIAENMTHPDAIVEAWMASRDHRHVLLGAHFKDIGLGFKAFGPRSAWVADLGLRKERGGSRCHPWRSGK